MSFSKFAIIVCLLCALFAFITVKCFAQPTSFGVFGAQIEYSAKYHKMGGGFFGGYKFSNNYIGINTHIPFTRERDVPIAAGLEYSYMIGSFAPYISGEYYTCGQEAISEGEGTQGFAFGAGMSYYLKSIPLKFSIWLNGIDKLSDVKDLGNYANVSVGIYKSF